MPRIFISALIFSVVAAILGATLSDDPYRLNTIGYPNDPGCGDAPR